MLPDLPETTELQAFLAVADQGSVAKAADALGLPRATVSRRLARLEERLGARLFRRTTRKVAMTPAGHDLDPHARRILEATVAATASVRHDPGPLRGLVRVSVPPGSDTPFDALLLDFCAAHPEVVMEIERSTRQVDLVGGGFDVALRATSQLDPGLIARRLGQVDLRAWATTAYLDRRGRPGELEELAHHDCLVGFDRGERPATRWPLLDGTTLAVRPRAAINDMSLLARACRQGLGIALLPTFFADGLEAVLPDRLGAISFLALVYAERGHLSPAARAFVDHVVAHAHTLDAFVQPPRADGAAPPSRKRR